MQIITHRTNCLNITQAERIVSAFGGAILTAAGLKRRGLTGLAMAAAGGDFLRRGLTGHSYFYEAIGIRAAPWGQGESISVPYELGIRVDRAITIEKPRGEVYRYFRNLQNLPRFMKHIISVREFDGNRSHWIIRAPAGRRVEWDAVIHNELPEERLAWRTLPGGDVQSAGSVLFRDAPGGRGTELHVELQYNPPAGIIGAAIGLLWGEEPGMQMDEDLHRLKQILEIGEVVTTEGQPSGAALPPGHETAWSRPLIDLTSEESFPASDAPAYHP